MGVNLVPIVKNFYITEETFPTTGDHSVQDGCVTPGTHRLLRFDFLSYNMGDTDLVVGRPADHPDLFELSASHGHYHLKNFNEFRLFDTSGNQVTKGYKQAFCLIDKERINPSASPTAKFTDCNVNQGVSAGWADLYNSQLPCQFIVIDGVLDGDYTLLSTTNLLHIFPEDTYDDNTIFTGLRIAGNTVTEIPPPIKRGVTVYENSDFKGRQQFFGPGRYDVAQLSGVGNDTISSVRVPTGLRVTLYSEAGFLGDTANFTEDANYIGNQLNDRTSSLVVE
mgnify:FL=1